MKKSFILSLLFLVSAHTLHCMDINPVNAKLLLDVSMLRGTVHPLIVDLCNSKQSRLCLAKETLPKPAIDASRDFNMPIYTIRHLDTTKFVCLQPCTKLKSIVEFVKGLRELPNPPHSSQEHTVAKWIKKNPSMLNTKKLNNDEQYAASLLESFQKHKYGIIQTVNVRQQSKL